MPEIPRSIRAEAVVLCHSNYGETDRMLTLYTRDYGKLRVIAKGVRKIKSRKSGHLEPFSRITVQLARGHDLYILTQAETVTAYSHIRANLELTGYTAVVIELLDKLTFEAEENRTLYRLLIETMDRLNEGSDPFITVSYYQVHLLDALGYKPELFACTICRKEIQPVDQFFSPEQGGIVCPQCAWKIQGARPASMQALKYLRHLQRSNFNTAFRANPDSTTRSEMEGLIESSFGYILERGLNAPKFMHQIRQVD